MNAIASRDILDLRREDLLEDYARRSKLGKDSVVRFGLRNLSVSVRDIIVRRAVDINVTSEQLKEIVLSGRSFVEHVVDPDQLANLGRLALLQNQLDKDTDYGVRLLSTALKLASPGDLYSQNKLILLQHHIIEGNSKDAEDMFECDPRLTEKSYGFLPAELNNPFTTGSEETYTAWLTAFNRVFHDNDLEPIRLSDHGETPFDRLRPSSGTKFIDAARNQPLVSVVLTVYQPDKQRLMTSVRSILQQSWSNFELIIVDDCSGGKYQEIFDDLELLDARITLIQASQNGGTYLARNLGYAAARGDYITGQDDDDWSHPQRLEHQVRLMETDSTAIGCRVRAVRCGEDLNRVFLDRLPVGQNASSLFIRREAYIAAGGYLPVRKAGDTEFHKRVEAITGRRIRDIQKPLSVIRILAGSLSRGDFRPGWIHPARMSFRSSYTLWHLESSPEDLCLSESKNPPVRIPRRLSTSENNHDQRKYDVVFAGDWQSYGGPQKSMLEEIHALKGIGLRVGILDFEAARFMYRRDRLPLNEHIQRLVNTAYIDELMYDDDVSVEILILRYPPILQFFTNKKSSLSIEKMLIVANQAPAELDGSDIRYRVQDVDHAAHSSFGVSPTWVPQGPQVRKILAEYLRPPKLATYDLPGILDPGEWWHERLWYRSNVPVVGRHSRDNIMKWPSESSTLEQVYRIDGQHDIRIMGGARTPSKVLGLSEVPDAWTVYDTDEMPVQDFLRSLDYFVYFQHPQAIEAFGRAILEAIATGIVVILPQHFEEVFGKAAIYTEPAGVASKIKELHSDSKLYKAQLQDSYQELTDRFSYRSYQNKIEGLLSNQKARCPHE